VKRVRAYHSGPKRRRARVRKALIVMPMAENNPQLDDLLDAVKAGARAAGVDARRVDETHSSACTTSRILKAIEDSELVIVDLTFERGNVYFEAGFAQGRGKIPIYLAASGVEIPFDLKDYPVIVYKNMRSLRELLAARLIGMFASAR